MWSAQNYKIKVRICSETIFNSGEKERNLVQSKVLVDRYGFVYFHAKTLKGQLKRQAFWLLKQYNSFDDKRAKLFLESIIKLFGVNKEELKENVPQEDTYRYEQGIMRISNLELDERIRAYFRELQRQDQQKGYYNISPHDLIEAQTHIRTGIQLEDGVIRDKMLTTYHTVKQGLIFYSTLSFSEDPTKYLADLQRIVHSFRRIGGGIHRGRGEIEAQMLINGEIVAVKEGENSVSIPSN